MKRTFSILLTRTNLTEINATINLADLKKENEKFAQKLNAYQKRHDMMWSEIDGGVLDGNSYQSIYYLESWAF